jgi:hypothetical protein
VMCAVPQGPLNLGGVDDQGLHGGRCAAARIPGKRLKRRARRR